MDVYGGLVKASTYIPNTQSIFSLDRKERLRMRMPLEVNKSDAIVDM